MKKSDKVKKIVRQIDENLSKMSEEERRIFFIEMGFKMTEEEKSIINEPARYLRETAYTGKQFQPGLLHKKTVIEDSKTTDANHELAAISEAIDKCQVAAELESAANPTIYSGNNEQPQDNMEKSDIAFAEKIIEELDKNLSKMTEKEREELFKECGLVFEKIPNQNEERHKQLIRLKAALATLYVLSRKKQTALLTTLQAVLELKKEQQKPKSGTEEMIEELGIQGCLVPGDHIDISNDHLRILAAQINEAVRQCDEAEKESVAYLIRKGPKL